MALAIGIAASPEFIWEVFPKEECGNFAWHIIRAAKILVFISGILFAATAKDRNVTGGNVAQTFEAVKRAEGPLSKANLGKLLPFLMIGAGILSFFLLP